MQMQRSRGKDKKPRGERTMLTPYEAERNVRAAIYYFSENGDPFPALKDTSVDTHRKNLTEVCRRLVSSPCRRLNYGLGSLDNYTTRLAFRLLALPPFLWVPSLRILDKGKINLSE